MSDAAHEALEEVMVRSKHHLETETIFKADTDVGQLVAMLRQHKAVGFLRVDLSQGSTQRILLTQKTKPLNEAEFAGVEEVLDMG